MSMQIHFYVSIYETDEQQTITSKHFKIIQVNNNWVQVFLQEKKHKLTTPMKFNRAVSAFIVSTLGEHGGVLAETARGKRAQSKLKSLTIVGEFENGDPGFPLGKCEGNCDSDKECQGNLHCFKRKPGHVDRVPGCSGGDLDDPGKNYCTSRIHFPFWLLKIGDNGIRKDNGNKMVNDPLGMCE
eukprot:90666_1